jgi:hypothetical protein
MMPALRPFWFSAFPFVLAFLCDGVRHQKALESVITEKA